MILKSFVKKFRQIEGSSALLRQNVNKLSRTQSFKLIFIFAGCSAKTNVREA